ncbi:cupin domain-containing protein [Novosphingobium sp. SG707]|uniref:cupin domain-containing protein n=1 Tax=Novosphingobium sp. SG707 TaxID=2586996 RepID=UPI001444D6B4|nr:cupin domain-containing protein [Novosphingobium sp. SG707]NKJ01913.1 putative cupin superfamily protein [Novosphingobium sp. SG707]
MPKIDLASLAHTNRTGYPPEHAGPVAGRWYSRLAPLSGFAHLGASHVVLKPGAWSSQRHWHDGEDEMVVMLSGEAVLVEDGTRSVMRAGDMAVFPAGVANGHHLINESGEDCTFLALSAGPRTSGGYSDIDMIFEGDRFLHRDGTPFAD